VPIFIKEKNEINPNDVEDTLISTHQLCPSFPSSSSFDSPGCHCSSYDDKPLLFSPAESFSPPFSDTSSAHATLSYNIWGSSQTDNNASAQEGEGKKDLHPRGKHTTARASDSGYAIYLSQYKRIPHVMPYAAQRCSTSIGPKHRRCHRKSGSMEWSTYLDARRGLGKVGTGSPM